MVRDFAGGAGTTVVSPGFWQPVRTKRVNRKKTRDRARIGTMNRFVLVLVLENNQTGWDVEDEDEDEDEWIG